MAEPQRPSLVCFGGSVTELVDWAKQAEQAGFDSMWTAEFYDRSTTVPLSAMAVSTSRIRLGSGIAYGFGRSPVVLAAEARDIDQLSGGRFTLGLGVGTKRMQQDWHGLDGEHPAPKMEELIPLLRKVWRIHEGPVHHDGRFYRCHIEPTGQPSPPLRDELPVYLAGVNDRMVAAAGAAADGLVGHPLFAPEYVRDYVRPALARGARRTGRPEPGVAGYVICSVDEDEKRARRRAAAQISFYAIVKTYDAVTDRMGFSAEVKRIRSAWKAGDQDGMIDAVSEEMVDTIAIAGTPAQCREQFAQRWSGVYETILLYPPTFGGAADVPTLIATFRG